MAITFEQQRKRQQYLLIAVLAIIGLTAVLLWRGFFAGSSETPPELSLSQRPQLTIDFNIFDTQAFKDIGTGTAPVEIPAEVGRKNPFIPF
ncbi:MAG: hypothetical protein Q7S63_00475 [bacterium]|nr:hypothetical protein [bacterium]